MPEEIEIRAAFDRVVALVEQGSKGFGEAIDLLRKMLPRVQDPQMRGRINGEIWRCEDALGRRYPMFFSQSGQDAWLENNIFKGKRAGVFVEIGGFDGVTGSNSLFFELMRGWSGLLIEPSPEFHARAAEVRRCRCLQVAVGDRDGEAEFFAIQEGLTQMGGLVGALDPSVRVAIEGHPLHRGGVVTVPTRPLAQILDEHGLTEVDLISLDVEGTEHKVLGGFPFEKYRIAAWTVEMHAAGALQVHRSMTGAGYRLAEVVGADAIYVQN